MLKYILAVFLLSAIPVSAETVDYEKMLAQGNIEAGQMRALIGQLQLQLIELRAENAKLKETQKPAETTK